MDYFIFHLLVMVILASGALLLCLQVWENYVRFTCVRKGNKGYKKALGLIASGDKSIVLDNLNYLDMIYVRTLASSKGYRVVKNDEYRERYALLISEALWDEVYKITMELTEKE